MSDSHASLVGGGGATYAPGSPLSGGRMPRHPGGGRDGRMGLHASRGYPPPYPSPASGMMAGALGDGGSWSSAYGVPPATHFYPHPAQRGAPPPPPRPQPFRHGGVGSGHGGFSRPEAYDGADYWRGVGGWQQQQPSPALLHQQHFYAPPVLHPGHRHVPTPPLSFPPHASAPSPEVGAGAAAMTSGPGFYPRVAGGGGVGSLFSPLSPEWPGSGRAAGAFSSGHSGVPGGGGGRDIGAAAATTQYYAGGSGR